MSCYPRRQQIDFLSLYCSHCLVMWSREKTKEQTLLLSCPDIGDRAAPSVIVPALPQSLLHQKRAREVGKWMKIIEFHAAEKMMNHKTEYFDKKSPISLALHSQLGQDSLQTVRILCFIVYLLLHLNKLRGSS